MFNAWLLKQLQEKEWTQADLARNSGLTKGAISKYINGRIPDETAIRKIAHSLKLSPETVFRAAGLLPPQSPETELIHRIVYLTSELPEEDQSDILEYAQLRHRLAEERGKNVQGTKKATAKSRQA
jgi:transcriptional regulator with XRE-family HTH domain